MEGGREVGMEGERKEGTRGRNGVDREDCKRGGSRREKINQWGGRKGEQRGVGREGDTFTSAEFYTWVEQVQ